MGSHRYRLRCEWCVYNGARGVGADCAVCGVCSASSICCGGMGSLSRFVSSGEGVVRDILQADR